MKLTDIIKTITVGAMFFIATGEYVRFALQISNDWYWLSIPALIIAVHIFIAKRLRSKVIVFWCVLSGVSGILALGAEYARYIVYESAFDYSGLNVILQLCAHAILVSVFFISAQKVQGGINQGT